jgi:hypothetical protein
MSRQWQKRSFVYVVLQFLAFAIAWKVVPMLDPPWGFILMVGWLIVFISLGFLGCRNTGGCFFFIRKNK